MTFSTLNIVSEMTTLQNELRKVVEQFEQRTGIPVNEVDVRLTRYVAHIGSLNVNDNQLAGTSKHRHDIRVNCSPPLRRDVP